MPTAVATPAALLLTVASTLTIAAVAQPAVPSATAPVERTIRGDVRTADGLGILGATVWLVGTRSATDSTLAATTDAAGAYRFVLPVSESSALVVRRRGFADARLPLPGPGGSAKKPAVAATATLASTAAPTARVVVPDTGVFTGATAQYFRHLAARRGEFVTRADLLRMAPVRTSSALRGLRGVEVVSSGSATTVRLRGRGCYPGVWLDGVSVGTRAFDVDMISPQSLIGIEVFSASSGVPMEYQTLETLSCGAVGFWTRRGDSDDGAALDLTSFTDPATVRSAADVEVPAQVAPGSAFVPRYPAEARASGVGGSVVVELVVDTDGSVERSTTGLVATASPDLADPVIWAASRLHFTPALVAGKPVRQLVQLVAVFQSSGRSARMP